MAPAAAAGHAARATGAEILRMRKADSTAVLTARRLCAARIAAAGRALAGRPDDAAVHRARRELKRARALLRLVRRAVPAEAYVAVNSGLRDIGRLLGSARDALVMRELARDTARACDVEPDAVRSLLTRFDRERRRRSQGIDTAGVRAGIEAARARLLRARVAGDGTLLATGFVRIYRRGRRALAAARELPRPARLHDWRKHVKHYWHALEALEPAWPRLMTALAAEVHRLADVLGDFHDCTLLAAQLKAAPVKPAVRRRLAAALKKRRAMLRERAFAIGERLYEERPRRLAPRAAQWWQLWIEAAPSSVLGPAQPVIARRRAARPGRARR